MNRQSRDTGLAAASPSGGTRFRASRVWLFLLLSGLTFAATATAQLPVIFLVRHAERAATSGRVPSDTGLSRVGETRAQHLAEELKDANITAIYTTEYKRTKETAMPLTRLAGIRPEVVAADDLRALTSKLKQASGNVLVVGHSNTLPQIINALGVGTRVAVSESDYDNLFVIVHEPEARLIHLHYR